MLCATSVVYMPKNFEPDADLIVINISSIEISTVQFRINHKSAIESEEDIDPETSNTFSDAIVMTAFEINSTIIVPDDCK